MTIVFKKEKQENLPILEIGDIISTTKSKPDYGIIIDIFLAKEETIQERIFKDILKYKVLFQKDKEIVNYDESQVKLYKTYYENFYKKIKE